MAKVTIDVSLPAYKYKEMYQGSVKNLVARSRDGRMIQLPLSIFQRFVTHKGVYGAFEIEFDENKKLVKIDKIL